MYVQECLARERQQERLKQAQEERSGNQVAALRRLERGSVAPSANCSPRGSASNGSAR